MGLDIFGMTTKVKPTGDFNTHEDCHRFSEEANNEAKTILRNKVEKLLKPLRKAWAEIEQDGEGWNEYALKRYRSRYFTFVEKLRPLIAKNYDWKIEPFTDAILDFPELEALVNRTLDAAYNEYDIYFRKVNFLFAYFQNKDKMIDECFAFVDIDDVDDIIYRCEEILEAKKNGDNLDEGETPEDLANSLLPTQSGFFFGSTDYDKWYYYDVKDCLKQMKKYRKLLMKEGVTGYMEFSW